MSLLRVHPDPGPAGQRKSPGGRHQLQLGACQAEQGVPQEGAVQRWREIPSGSREPRRGGGLHLRQAYKPLENSDDVVVPS